MDIPPSLGNFIGGGWKPTQNGHTIAVVSPSDGNLITQIPASDQADVNAAVAAARRAFNDGEWSRLSPVDRGRRLHALAGEISAHSDELADIESLDTGKPLGEATNDVNAAARYFEFYAGAADKIHGEVIPYSRGFHVQSVREPLGVTAHIIPWNYPAQMFGRTLAPALAMGNSVVLKPAEDACLAPLKLTELASKCGLGEAINVVCGRGETAGAALAGHPGINFLSFTGSPETGAEVQAAAAANHVACTLELGGKSPQVVFADADIDSAIPAVVNAIIQNAGQTCSAGSRVLIEQSIFKETVQRLASEFEQLEAGPVAGGFNLGALISENQKARVESYINMAERSQIVARGKIARVAPKGGFYVAPVLISPVEPDSPLAQEEIFGPVLSCIPFTDESEAVAIANATPYGLVAGVWTRDGGRQIRIAKALHCGQVYVNCYGAGGGIELPFGGVGKSGHGREKGFEALRGFSQTKTIIQKY